tara:strand:- start:685 stop:840 length:156 start_codon:yes stop_codon:yes gene_type:complete
MIRSGYYYWQYVYANRELIDMDRNISAKPKLKSPFQNFWRTMNNFGECVKG